MRTLLTLALLLSVSGGCVTFTPTPVTEAPEPTHYKIIGYVAPRADFSRINAQKLTHINYAFGLVNNSGEAYIRSNAAPHFAQLQALKGRNPNLKVILSIGGWGADNFSDAALTEESRQKFTRSCLNLLRLYALDGIDLDWEYPGQPGPGIRFRREDKQNFTAMLRDLRAQLDALSDERKRTGADRYTLTIATAGGKYFEHTEMEKVHQYVDWINIMTYDFYGTFSGPGHHSGLYSPGSGAARRTTLSDVEDHLRAGIPAAKLVVGAAFYAKSWTNVATLNPSPTGGKYSRGLSYSALKREILPNKEYQRHWDSVAKASYLWNPNNGVFISYEDPEALRAKCDFVKQRQLGGVMFWEYSEDPDENLLDVLVQELAPTNTPPAIVNKPAATRTSAATNRSR